MDPELRRAFSLVPVSTGEAIAGADAVAASGLPAGTAVPPIAAGAAGTTVPPVAAATTAPAKGEEAKAECAYCPELWRGARGNPRSLCSLGSLSR